MQNLVVFVIETWPFATCRYVCNLLTNSQLCYLRWKNDTLSDAGLVLRLFLLFLGDAEPVYVCPAAVVGLDGRASAEHTHLGTYPFAFSGLEFVAQRFELLSVEAVAEVAFHHQVVSAFAFGYFLAIGAELNA